MTPQARAGERPAKPLAGVLWMLMAQCCGAGMAGIVRLLASELHAFELSFFRAAFGLAWMLPVMACSGAALRTTRTAPFVLRAVLALLGIIGGYHGYAHLPLAEAVALNFTLPLFATVGAALFIGERVRARRRTAVAVGFVGVLVVVRPGSGSFGPVALVVLGGAASGAAALLVMKRLTRTEAPNTIVAYMTLYLAPMALVPALLVWRWPGLEAWPWLVALGLAGTAGQLCITRAFAAADASAMLPLEYLQLPLAAAIGYLAFAEQPSPWTFAGAAVIAASALYIAHREAVVARRPVRSMTPN